LKRKSEEEAPEGQEADQFGDKKRINVII